jgi:cell division protein FtsB
MVGLATALKSLASATPAGTPDVSLGSIPGEGPQRQRGHGTSSVWLPPVLSDLEARIADLEGDRGGPSDRSELNVLRQRTERLEYEVAELRAQTARRLDAAAREVAAGRREAEEARSENVVLRAKVADLTSLLAHSQAAATPTPNGQHA